MGSTEEARPDSLPNADPRQDGAACGRLAIVGGCGHMGLPLGVAFARQGLRVELIDTDAERVAQVNAGVVPFRDHEAEPLLRQLVQAGQLRATTDAIGLGQAATIVIALGTPMHEHLDLGMRAFDEVIRQVFDGVQPGQLLVLRSTVAPGTTDRLARQLGARGVDADLAYCPERSAQGRSLAELPVLPQLVAGVTARAAQRASALFALIAPKVLSLRPIEAELAKLYCNAWRYINFAISNQFYLLAQQFDADFGRIYESLREDYPRMASFARPGFAAGPCLLKDTLQLAAFNHDSFSLGQGAIMVNEGLPLLIVQNLRRRYPLRDMTVGILGMAFKPESDDARGSLSYKLRQVLTPECRKVLCTDPYVVDADLVPLVEVLDRAELLIVGTPHECYRQLHARQPLIDVTGLCRGASG